MAIAITDREKIVPLALLYDYGLGLFLDSKMTTTIRRAQKLFDQYVA